MQVSAKLDYALRALAELAARTDESGSGWSKADQLATAQQIPAKFLEGILNELRRNGLVMSRRGADGGYRLSRPASEISVADVIRAIDGPLAGVRGARPEDADYLPPAQALREVWIATRAALRAVLEAVTLADVVSGQLPPQVAELLLQPGAWDRR